MTKRLTRLSPWQTAKTLAAFYFVFALIFAIPLGLLSSFMPTPPGEEKPGLFFFLGLPFAYGIAGLIFIPLACWLYNLVAKHVGGIEMTFDNTAEN